MSSAIRKKLLKIYTKIDKLAVKGKDQIYEYHKLIDEYIDRGDFDNFTQTLYYYYTIDVSKYNGNILDIKNKTWPDVLFETNSTFQKKLKKVYNDSKTYQQGYDVYSEDVNTLSFQVSSPLSVTYSITNSTQSLVPSRVGNQIFFTYNDPGFVSPTYSVYGMELYKCEWITVNGIEKPFNKTLELFQTFRILATQSTYLTEMSVSHGREYLVRIFSRNSNLQFTQLNYKLSVTKNTLLGQITEVDDYQQDVKYYNQNSNLAQYLGLKNIYLEVTKTGTASVYVTYTNPAYTPEQNLLKRYEVALTYLLS